MMRIVYLILLVCAVSTTGKLLIAGGKKATKTQFPYFAQLRMFVYFRGRIEEALACGASLITESWLLSAAHCFYYLELTLKLIPNDLQKLIDDNLLIVYMGSNVRFSKKASKNFVKRFVLHPDFVMKRNKDEIVIQIKNDIALVRLKKKYTLNNYIKIIQLPEPIRDFKKWMKQCKTVTVVGTGLKKPKTNSSEKGEYEKFVMYAKERLMSFEELVKSFEKLLKCFESFGWNLDAERIDYLSGVIITQNEWLRGHSMPGDSGGPAICYGRKEPILYGIVSMGLPPCFKNATRLVFHERVDKYLKFIQSTVKNLKRHKKKRGVAVKPIHN